MAGLVERLPEATPPLSFQELSTEQLVKIAFSKMRAKLISTPQFLQVLRSNPPKDGLISGTFDFNLDFEWGNYKHHVVLDDSKKELIWEKSFDFSFMGPTILQVAKVSPHEDPPILYTWQSSDMPEPLIYADPPVAGKKIDVFLLV